jgi:hypothetical protein
MMHDTAVQKASQSQTKEASSGGWYGFIRSAIVSGFAAYGSAQIGMAPSSFQAATADDAQPDKHSVKTPGVVTSNPSVAETAPVRVRPSKIPVEPVWRHA